MHIALSVQFGRDDQLIFAQQLGVEHVVANMERRWDLETLTALKNRVEKTGLKLEAVEMLVATDMDEAVAAVRAIGAAGIGLVSCVCGPVTRGQFAPEGRGGALVDSAATAALAAPEKPQVLAEAARAAGVAIAWTGKSALVAGGGLDLPLGELGDDPAAAIAALQDPVLIASACNRRGGKQAFLDEGDVNLPRVLWALRKAGFSGPLLAYPAPGMVGDSEWGHKGRAYDLGYLKAVLQAIQSH
jgi:hypothetical protein